MNAIIMEDTHKDEYDLNGHERSQKARLAKLFLSHSFIIKF